MPEAIAPSHVFDFTRRANLFCDKGSDSLLRRRATEVSVMIANFIVDLSARRREALIGGCEPPFRVSDRNEELCLEEATY